MQVPRPRDEWRRGDGDLASVPRNGVTGTPTEFDADELSPLSRLRLRILRRLGYRCAETFLLEELLRHHLRSRLSNRRVAASGWASWALDVFALLEKPVLGDAAHTTSTSFGRGALYHKIAILGPSLGETAHDFSPILHDVMGRRTSCKDQVLSADAVCQCRSDGRLGGLFDP